MKERIRGPLIALIVCAAVTGVGYAMAHDAERGVEQQEYTGRHVLIKKAIGSASAALGTTGVLAVGIPATGLSLVWLGLAIKGGKAAGGPRGPEHR
jgi:hypothetical protein